MNFTSKLLQTYHQNPTLKEMLWKCNNSNSMSSDATFGDLTTNYAEYTPDYTSCQTEQYDTSAVYNSEYDYSCYDGSYDGSGRKYTGIGFVITFF